MKAMLTDENKNLLWTDVEDPVIKDDEVLVKTHAFALNRADLMQRNGEYPSPPGCPQWMGLEIAGEIVKMGSLAKEKSDFKVGDKVCALLGGGGYSEYSAVKYDMLLPIPNGFSYVEAAAIPEVYATAYLNLFIEGNLQKNETYLVFAGASGVGIASTQIAKAYGAKVITTVRSNDKKEALKKFGADIIINSKEESLEKIFSENEVNLVIDCVGGKDMGKYFSLMARNGRWINIATLGGDITQIDLRNLFKMGHRLIGSTLRSRTPEMKAYILSELKKNVFPYFENGTFKPEIYEVFDVSKTEEAHKLMADNKNIGKIVVTL